MIPRREEKIARKHPQNKERWPKSVKPANKVTCSPGECRASFRTRASLKIRKICELLIFTVVDVVDVDDVDDVVDAVDVVNVVDVVDVNDVVDVDLQNILHATTLLLDINWSLGCHRA